jgi:Fic family protein
MTRYIYELPDWPHFRWRHEKLAQDLTAVRHRQGRMLGRMEAFGLKLREEALLRTLTEEVVKSSEIEGEVLNRDQVRSSLARRLGIEIGALTPSNLDVEGVVELVLDATRNYDKPLTAERLFGWHASLFPTGRSHLRKIKVGAWRTIESGPMQVVSGALDHERVHYEAPSADNVQLEMDAFLMWIEGDGDGIDPVLKAAIAHLWFVTIHPFEDGNGRIGRAIADMMLARSEKSPQRFYSMSAQIRKERGKYYDYLEDAQKGDLDITEHLDWFLGCLDRAFDNAETILADVLRKARFWELHAGESFNERQRLVINRLLDGFIGKLNSSKWAKLAKTSQDTAGRDIDDLIRRHALVREPGGGRSTSYALIATPSDALRVIADYTLAYRSGIASGPKLRDDEGKAKRRQEIKDLASAISDLANSGTKNTIGYREFEPILHQLHQEGFFPDERLLSAFAFTTNSTNRSR